MYNLSNLIQSMINYNYFTILSFSLLPSYKSFTKNDGD